MKRSGGLPEVVKAAELTIDSFYSRDLPRSPPSSLPPQMSRYTRITENVTEIGRSGLPKTAPQTATQEVGVEERNVLELSYAENGADGWCRQAFAISIVVSIIKVPTLPT